MKMHVHHIKTVDSIIENLIAGAVAGFVVDLQFEVLGWIARIELVIASIILYAVSVYLKNKGGN